MLITSHHNRPINFPVSADSADIFTLVPGDNEVPGDILPRLETQFLFAHMKSLGVVEYQTPEPAAGPLPEPKPAKKKKRKSKKEEF